MPGRISVFPTAPIWMRSRRIIRCFCARGAGTPAWVNSLRAAPVRDRLRRRPIPKAARSCRDEAGEPSGILLEGTAISLVREHIPPPTVESLATQMKAAQTLALSLGMTGIHDFDDQECFAALQIMRERGDLGLRVRQEFQQALSRCGAGSGLAARLRRRLDSARRPEDFRGRRAWSAHRRR